MTFDIREHIAFDAKGRAQCPTCLQDGKTGKHLSVLENGAYKCFRGCTPDEIRHALGAKRETTVPPPATSSSPPPKRVLVSPPKVREATDRLLTQSTHALKWLIDRGITPEMIEHYRLGVVRTKVGDSTKATGFSHLPAIAIALPNPDGTAYYQKKRVRPWVEKAEQPDGYQPWSQYGIPAMVYSTHKPDSPTATWLCEGEWDAIVMGWAVRNSHLKNDIQVSCFTCGAGNVPPKDELAKLTAPIHIWYDADSAGLNGAKKLQALLKENGIINQVPALEDSEAGWDVSDAIAAGLFHRFAENSQGGLKWEPPKSENPLRDRLVINDVMIANAPDYTDWLVDDILTADELFLLAASPRAGKSLLALTLSHAVATGGKFLGRPVSQGAVIYIRCEDSDTKTKERAIKQGWGAGLPIYWLDKFKLNELDYLAELIEEVDARLVVFDTLSRIRDSSVSESSAEMSQQLEPLQEMCKRFRVCGLLIHHTGKVSTDNAGTINVYDTIRGSSAIRATCRGTLILAADERNYRLYVENGWGKLDLQVLLDAHTLTWKLLGNWIAPNVDLSQKDRVLNYLTQVGKATIEEIAEGTQLPKRSLYEVLKRLQSDEIIEKHGSRQSAIYIRSSIQQIQQLNTLLNSQDTDREIISPPIQQLPESGSPPEKVILNFKSDQKNDHFLGSPPTPHTLELVDKNAENHTQQSIPNSTAIQHGINTDKKSDPGKRKKMVTELSSADAQAIQQLPGLDWWLHHVEFNTLVRVIKHRTNEVDIYVPGLGRRTCSPDLLVPPRDDSTDR